MIVKKTDDVNVYLHLAGLDINGSLNYVIKYGKLFNYGEYQDLFKQNVANCIFVRLNLILVKMRVWID